VKPVKFDYHAPASLDEALALLRRYGGDAKILAGGQSLMPLLNFRLSRPAALVDLKLAAARDGTISALSARLIIDNGASAGFTAGIASLLLGSTYRIPNVSIEAYEVATNKAPAGAYRAPGAPQAYFALESAIDELASRVGRDPIDLRLAHAATEGDLRTDGKPWPRVGLRECLSGAQAHPLYRAPRRDGEGTGVAVGGWLGGREPATAACRVEPLWRRCTSVS